MPETHSFRAKLGAGDISKYLTILTGIFLNGVNANNLTLSHDVSLRAPSDYDLPATRGAYGQTCRCMYVSEFQPFSRSS